MFCGVVVEGRLETPTLLLVALSSFAPLPAVGKTIAIAFDHIDDGLVRDTYGWSLEASRGGGELLMVLMAFGAVFTQYAIALELRLAYCGLQDANLDLQVKASNTCVSGQSNAEVFLVDTHGSRCLWHCCV